MSNVFDQLSTNDNTPEESPSELNETTDTQKQTDDNSDEFSYTPKALKTITQELLKNGLIESSSKPDLYQRLLSEKNTLSQIFEPLDLHISHDDIRGIAYLTVLKNDDDSDSWSHPLVRKKPLTLEQSLVVAILRQYYITYELDHGQGAANISIGLEELLALVNTYYGNNGSESADQKRLTETMNKLKEQGIVSAINKYDQITIRPIIVHIANHENLTLLLKAMKEKTNDKLEEQADIQQQSVEGENNE